MRIFPSFESFDRQILLSLMKFVKKFSLMTEDLFKLALWPQLSSYLCHLYQNSHLQQFFTLWSCLCCFCLTGYLCEYFIWLILHEKLIFCFVHLEVQALRCQLLKVSSLHSFPQYNYYLLWLFFINIHQKQKKSSAENLLGVSFSPYLKSCRFNYNIQQKIKILSNQMSCDSAIEEQQKNTTPKQSLVIEQTNIKDNISYLEKASIRLSPRLKTKKKNQDASYIINEAPLEDSIEEMKQKVRQQKRQREKNVDLMKKTDSLRNRLTEIEQERSKIVDSLKEVNLEISAIRNENRSNSQLHFREVIAEDVKALRNAKQLVKYYKEKKQELEQRKMSQAFKIIANLKTQFAQNNKNKQTIEQTKKEQKRMAISQRLDQAKRNRVTQRIIDQETNMFISRMLRQGKELERKKINSLRETFYKKKHKQRSPYHNSLSNDHSHEKSQFIECQDQLGLRKDKSEQLGYPIKKYKKTKWAQQLQEDRQKERQEIIMEKLNRSNARKKRFKYGELVVSLFSQKRRARTLPGHDDQGEIFSMGQKFRLNNQSNSSRMHKETRLTKIINRHTQSLKMSPNKNRSFSKSQYHQQKSPQQLEAQAKKIQRQKQIRKQTQERLKRIGNAIERKQQVKYKSHYQNYLGLFKHSKQSTHENLSKILNNDRISKKEKFEKVMKAAETLENRAKLKEEVLRKMDESSDELFMESINAKIMILQSI